MIRAPSQAAPPSGTDHVQRVRGRAAVLNRLVRLLRLNDSAL